jgi:hypothetical protein
VDSPDLYQAVAAGGDVETFETIAAMMGKNREALHTMG